MVNIASDIRATRERDVDSRNPAKKQRAIEEMLGCRENRFKVPQPMPENVGDFHPAETGKHIRASLPWFLPERGAHRLGPCGCNKLAEERDHQILRFPSYFQMPNSRIYNGEAL
jgi:hypothetical protein